MIERRWRLVGPFAFTSVGSTDGKVQIADACDFRVKMRVRVANGPNRLDLEVKRVNSETELELGPLGKITERADLSAFPVGSMILAIEQPRNDIPLQEIERAVYEEEPIVAIRNMLVSPCVGEPIGTSTDANGNVSLNVNVGNIGSGIIPPSFTKIILTRDPSSKNVVVAEYYDHSTLLSTLNLFYDCDEDLIEVNRAFPP